ncbi:hypothetical protein CYMTET_16482 [Cymbomonas tetramitiformis]|uniref:Uncharacterized protein n=1 Tax=Cymbomonas tetramitiformis TaxID=36881 RepID=A0AAE0GCF5_9CHLO|nr:hypothetical protein CYMTET_36939 [Cymbomonas tetramitiformis]KAK3261327.1 hypothetical protein CYMTET_29761 [Cymbomonas tetramitiformis]KAK3275385.1 hypothetical protein CYMTET_16482 [Cymbomonas tetramitiformis]
MSAKDLKISGNKAFESQRYEEAKHFYTLALEAPDATEAGIHVLYSSRSAAHLALKQPSAALTDATAAVQNKPGWPKAFSRRGAAQMKLKDYAGAAESFRRAYEAEGTEEYCLNLVTESYRYYVTGRELQPGQSWGPGDWAANIDKGGYQQLLLCGKLKGPKWELVRLAAVLQLAGLAKCPSHK